MSRKENLHNGVRIIMPSLYTLKISYVFNYKISITLLYNMSRMSENPIRQQIYKILFMVARPFLEYRHCYMRAGDGVGEGVVVIVETITASFGDCVQLVVG